MKKNFRDQIRFYINSKFPNKKIKIKFEGEDIVQEIVKAVLLIELAGSCKDWLS